MSPSEEKDRVTLVGPVWPFRGGIAQHTTMLHREFRRSAAIQTISFSRQFPMWLFPGKSDRDPEYVGHQEPCVQYLLDPLNPLTWRTAVRTILGFHPDRVVFAWWTVFWAPCLAYMARALRRRDLEVVFLCHNVIEHETAAWKVWTAKKILRNASRFVVQSQADAEILRHLIPEAKVQIQSHSVYEHFPEPCGCLERRAALELLFFGFVRPYKGLTTLLEAMSRLKSLDVRLTVAGEFWQDRKPVEDLITRRDLQSTVEILDRYHSEAETAELFARADAIVLPYLSATGSGVASLACRYSKPVVASAVGGLRDVVEDGKTGFLVPPEDVDALTEVLSRLTRESCRAMSAHIDKKRQALTWQDLTVALMHHSAD